MQSLHPAPASAFRSRVVFENAEVSFGFSAGATLADVADWVEGVARSKHSTPVAIEIKMAASSISFPTSTGAPHGTH